MQDYHPGSYGDQQHVSGMNVGSAFSVFHMHPAVEPDVKRKSPDYWVGYGHLPHVAQDRNVSLAIYRIPAKKGIMEAGLPGYTHAWFPEYWFDSAFVAENYAFGKKGDTYCAFICYNPLHFREGTHDDLIQNGKRTFWITEAGSKDEDGSFRSFYGRILKNGVEFDDRALELNYFSGDRHYRLTYGADFELDGKVVNTRYKRYETPYCTAARKTKTINIFNAGKSLFLDFNNMIREIVVK